MAEVFGELRKGEATFGEELVLNKLRANLPRDFVVYVECPLRDTRNLRFPDFIVLTNYGVLVLEVKDWVEILKADAYGGDIRTRSGEVRHEKNPVLTARDFALALTNMLKKRPELVRMMSSGWMSPGGRQWFYQTFKVPSLFACVRLGVKNSSWARQISKRIFS